MSKRVKIDFESINKGKYEIIPPEKIAETNARIKKEMKNKFSEYPLTLKHTVKEIVKDNDALMTHVCEGKVFYVIHVEDSSYQIEIDSNDDEWRATYLYPKFKAITLMRWIRKGVENGKLIQIK